MNMTLPSLKLIGKRSRTVSLRLMILIPLLLQIFAPLGSAQKAGVPSPPGQDKPQAPAAAGNKKNREKIPKPAATLVITDVKSYQEGGKQRVAIATSGAIEYKESELRNPSRLVIDFFNVENKASIQNLAINAGKVKQLRIRQYQESEPKITRLVFDLEGNSAKHEIAASEHSIIISFLEGELSEAAKPAPIAAKLAASAEQPTATPKGKPASSTAQRARAETRKTAAEPSAPAESTSQPQPPATALVQAKPSVKSAQPIFTSVNTSAFQATAPKPEAPAASPTQESRYTGQPLTLDLVDIPLIDFFRLMAEEGGINIVMDPGIRGTLSIKVVKVPWDQIFDAALLNNGLDKQIEGNLVRIALKSTLQEEAKQREALKKANLLAADIETRVKRLNYAKATAFVGPLADQKTVRGTVVVDERTNSLILTDIPTSIDKMIALIETLDIPQAQVEIEARIVSATRDFARDVGIQFGFIEGNLERVTTGGPNTTSGIGGYRPSLTPKSAYISGNPATGRGAAESKGSESGAISTGTSDQSKGNYNVNLPSGKAFGGLGISIGNIFDTFLLDAAITAGESKGLAKLISQPKVTAHNNSSASITQGFRFPVQIVANNTVTVQFQNAALTLTVTPQITYEGNIVLDLKVENNTPDFAKAVNGIPSIRTSEATTRVLVTDGGTTVIGGILIDTESNTEDRVPGLASLPLIGNAFKRTSISHTTQEVLFFITPRVIK